MDLTHPHSKPAAPKKERLYPTYLVTREEVDVMAGRCYTELRKPDRDESYFVMLSGVTINR